VTGPDSPSAPPPGEGLSRELARVTGRLRSMALDQLPVARVLETAQVLADLVAGAAGEQHRVVPEVAPYAAADQIAVLGAEVERAADALGEAPAVALFEAARAALVDLRHSL
jgi:hypothetical protein